MHRQTPMQAGFVGYSSGGARSLVDAVTDTTGMQEMAGSIMFGEARSKIESPQNYGFTSVVLPAIKDAEGKVKAAAEAYLSFMGGNRSFPVATIMDDRRHRPWGLKPGENAQYDDIGQMTLMRRTGLFMISLDTEKKADGKVAVSEFAADDNQEAKERMVSMRHVSKSPQARPKEGSEEGKDHKHEGESVNTEIRCTKGRIEFRAGDKVVGFYDVAADTWTFKAKVILNEATESITDKAPRIDHKK